MSRQRVRFADNPDNGEDERPSKRARLPEGLEDPDEEPTPDKPYEKKHTLDSDEEDNAEPDNKLDMKKVEGQEEATEEYDGNIKLMAFNMKEDLEEGHFDADGNFIYDKKEKDIRDNWLDNVDWDIVKSRAGKHWQQMTDSDEPEQAVAFDIKAACQRLLEILQDKETIGKSLKRLNSEKGNAAEERKRRWAAKKAGQAYEADNSKAVSELTTLADGLVSAGHMQAYDFDAAALQKLIEQQSPTKPKVEDSFDMFADMPTTSKPTGSADVKPESGVAAPVSLDDKVMWHYRLENKDEAEVKGPFTSQQMMKFVEDGPLKDGGFVKRVGTDSFYDVKRIDFDLYD
ncbi:Lin1-like protein [Aphelenchoides avenae]|nr:Lin1-like protein [Aphelenchus avenae]